MVAVPATAWLPVRHNTTRGRPFADRVRVQVVGGRGGKGLVSFESLSQIKKRPVGGRGGAGGDVVLEASHSIPDLAFQSFVLRGRDGSDAAGATCGRSGRAKKFMVPVGTVVKEVVRVYDLEAPPEEEEVDEGGSGWSAAAGAAEDSEVDGGDVQTAGRGRQRRRNRGLRGSIPDDDGDGDDDDGDDADADSSSSAAATAAGGSSEEGAGEVVRYTRAGHAYRERKYVLADMDTHGQALVVARGGRPGAGNKGSSLTYSEQLNAVTKPHVAGV